MFTTRMLRRAMTHAAASSSSSTARQSTIKSTKQVMELTEAAAKRIHELLGNKGAEYLKIGIRTPRVQRHDVHDELRRRER